MKVLLRNPNTKLFYAGPDTWTENPGDAVDFRKTDHALDAVSEFALNVEILMHFEDPFFQIPLAIVNAQN